MAWVLFHKVILTLATKYEGFLEWDSMDWDNDDGSSDRDKDNVKKINGILPDGTKELHELRFSADAFSVDEVKAWIKAKGLSALELQPADRSQEGWFSEGMLAKDSRLEEEFEVARVGNYPQGNLTSDIFDEVVSSFKPTHHEPAMTLGHVTKSHNDKPAYGWVSGLRRVGDRLLARGKQISTDLDNLVKVGRYKKRSIGLRVAENGKHYLHHLAFLGSASPACKGLANIYDDNSDVESQKLFEIETEFNFKQGDEYVKTYTEEEVRNQIAKTERDTANRAKAEAKAEFDEELKTGTDKAKAEAKAEALKEFSDKEKRAETERNYRSDIDSRIKKLFDDKKIVSAQVEPLRALAYSLQGSEDLNFSEKDKDGENVDITSKTIDALFNIAEYSGTAPEGGLKDPENKHSREEGVDGNYSEEKRQIKELMKEDPSLTYSDAMRKVRFNMAD